MGITGECRKQMRTGWVCIRAGRSSAAVHSDAATNPRAPKFPCWPALHNSPTSLHLSHPACSIVVTGDHSTPVEFGDHSHEPVPFTIAHVRHVVRPLCWRFQSCTPVHLRVGALLELAWGVPAGSPCAVHCFRCRCRGRRLQWTAKLFLSCPVLCALCTAFSAIVTAS